MTVRIKRKPRYNALLSEEGSGFLKSSASRTVSESMMSSSTMSDAASVHAVAAASESQTNNGSLYLWVTPKIKTKV